MGSRETGLVIHFFFHAFNFSSLPPPHSAVRKGDKRIMSTRISTNNKGQNDSASHKIEGYFSLTEQFKHK